MRAPLVLVLLGPLLGLTLLVGCGPACDSKNVCAVTGKPGDVDVCDGKDFITCDDKHRGQEILCPAAEAKKAVCGAAGWSFESGGQ